jgi:hypothetical protein
MQCAQSDDRSRHAGLRPDPLTRKPRKGEHNRRSCSRTNAAVRGSGWLRSSLPLSFRPMASDVPGRDGKAAPQPNQKAGPA